MEPSVSCYSLPLNIDPEWEPIVSKVLSGVRISPEEGLSLYEEADLGLLGMLADSVRQSKNGEFAYFNRNFHIEPTNLCAFRCRFCSYVRRAGDPDAWELSTEEILNTVRKHYASGSTEVHITGGAHPDKGLEDYATLLKAIRQEAPGLHIKAFSAVELDYMFRKSKVSVDQGISTLIESGLGSIPGGGAEIFDETIRHQLCPEKSTAETWLDIHERAHKAGLVSNATMLYGHIESYQQRIDHLERLRALQDKTGGFNCFIPLKFKKGNNPLGILTPETSAPEDLRNFAVARIYLDNFTHIKAYWPMIGREMASISLSFGVDDLDGTIDDSTRIYSMAGAEEQNPSLSSEDLIGIIKKTGRIPVERNSLYQSLRVF